MSLDLPLFDEDTWNSLPDFFDHLPEPVRLVLWVYEQADPATKTAARLLTTLGDRFDTVDTRVLQAGRDAGFYPIIGVMGFEGGEVIDYGLRFIGLPSGFQLTSLIAAIQCVSFRGSTSEARTRIQLSRLTRKVKLEVITTAGDESGGKMAQIAFNMAVFSPLVSAYLIMGDAFPQLMFRYSITRVPHTIINQRTHLEGVVDEATLLRHIAAAI